MLIMILDRYSLFGLPGMLNWLEFSYIRSRDRVVEGRFCYGDRTIAGFEPNGLNNCSTTEFLVYIFYADTPKLGSFCPILTFVALISSCIGIS